MDAVIVAERARPSISNIDGQGRAARPSIGPLLAIPSRMHDARVHVCMCLHVHGLRHDACSCPARARIEFFVAPPGQGRGWATLAMDLDFDDWFMDVIPKKKVARVAITPEQHACRGEATAVGRGSTHVASGVQGLQFSHGVCKAADCVECRVRKLRKSMLWRSAASLTGPARGKLGKFWLATKFDSTGAFMGFGCQACYQFTKARIAEKIGDRWENPR